MTARHRDHQGNARRVMEDTARAAKLSLMGASSGVLVVLGGIACDATQAITAGSWLTIATSAVGAVLIWIEHRVLSKRARVKGASDAAQRAVHDNTQDCGLAESAGHHVPVLVAGADPLSGADGVE